MTLSDKLRGWARQIKRDGVTLWFAYRNPGTPMLSKLLCMIVVAYALSPIDLVPDFIPILGYVDDVLLLPGLIWLAVRLIPDEVLVTCRIQAEAWLETQGKKPRSHWGVGLILCMWFLAAFGVWQALR